jgi:hypothetical protein
VSKVYAAQWNGVTRQRSSNKAYTHASVVRWSNGSEDIASFHCSESAAAKGVLTAQQKSNGARVIAVVPAMLVITTPVLPFLEKLLSL